MDRVVTAVEPAASEVVSGNGRDPREQFLWSVCQALAEAEAGNDKAKVTTRRGGLDGELARRVNALIQRQTQFSRELTRVARVVGRDGRMEERVKFDGTTGSWAAAVASTNGLIDDLVRPTNEVARVLSAVADGDLSQKMALTIEGRPVKGEFQRIGAVVNAMVDQLSSFSAEVTRVAREVGTDGKLGGQA